MEFEFNTEQKEIIKAAREFAKGEFDPDRCLALDAACEFPKKIFKKACRLGFVGIHIPESFSGQGMGLFEYALVAETLCRKDSTLGTALSLSTYGAESILHDAAPDLKKKILPKIVQGKIQLGTRLIYPETDVQLPVARKKKGQWVLNGKVEAVVNGTAAGLYCILCRTPDENYDDENYDAENYDNGSVSMVLIDKKWEGVSVSSSADTMGLRGTSLSDLTVDEVAVPVANFLGTIGKGLEQAHKFMNESFIQCAAMALGIAQGAFDHALAYTKQREQFGSKLADFQILRHRLADMALDIKKARLITYEAALSYDNGNIDPGSSAAAKLSACKTATDVSFQAIQLLGGYGYMSEYHVERYYRDAKMMEIVAGSPDQLKDIVSATVIGKVPAIS